MKEPLSEEIPDPSPLVLPGYNLPENIFNRGKPFYLEKDPLTGTINFDNKPTLSNVEEDDFSEYEENSSKSNTFNKNNIDRKDTVGSHKNSDVNQLVPNFHDFLNLPVKYNSDKYVYPLISSSYANTKVQGNVNKHQNHKNYAHLVTQKPTKGTTASYYYATESSKPPSNIKPNEEYESQGDYSYEEYDFSTKPNTEHIYLTTTQPTTTTVAAATIKTITTTTRPTTKKTMSLFQQLFGDYDETETEVAPTAHYPISDNIHSQSNTTAPTQTGGANYYEYQYEDDIGESDASVNTQEINGHVKTNLTAETTTAVTSTTTTTTTTTTTAAPISFSSPKTYYPSTEAPTTERTTKTTMASKVNSHPTPSLQPTSQSESVAYETVPSTTIHIPPHQNIATFLVGNHQNVGGEYVGSVIEDHVHVDDHHRHNSDRDKFLTGNSVNIHPFKHSEAPLTVGMSVDRVKQGIPGQVVDEKLNGNGEEYGKHKVVFPNDKAPGNVKAL